MDTIPTSVTAERGNDDSSGAVAPPFDQGQAAPAATDVWHRFTGPNANEPPRALVAAIIPGRGDVPGHLVLAQRPVEKTELKRHANLIAAAPTMLAALVQASNELEEHIDADDGRPNWAMRLKTEIDAAIKRASNS